jgi:aldehyde dehydrogenase (NAD+)
MDPLIGAITGGNCAVLKCSKSSIHVSAVIKEMIDNAFPEKYIYCAEPTCPYEEILGPIYDYIFFTGSKAIGKVIMSKASENLTPVSLELGGKSPCIVEESADIPYAARRIVWGKFINGGQTCIAPDYIFVNVLVKEELIIELTKQMEEMYPNSLDDSKYPKIISERHFQRLVSLIDAEKKVIGGQRASEKMRISPTILPEANFESPAMQNEIFGPILPIITYTSRDEIFNYLEGRDKPLAFYLFTKNHANVKEYMERVSFGGGCVNDVIMHMVNEHLPFGGVGASGMGVYHGKYNFDTFTREKGVLYKNTKLEMKAIYRPFTDKKMAFLKRIL